MKKIGIVLAVITLLSAGGAVYHFYGKVYEFRFSKPQIQEKLNEKLPFTKTYLIFFDVQLDNPRVNLEDGSNRINAGLDIVLDIRIGSENLPLGGTVDVSGGVEYAPSEGEFFLTDPIIEGLSVQGVPAKYTDKVNLVLTKALREFYSKHPVYSLKPTDLKHIAAKTILKNVIIENSELVVTLGI